MEVVTASVVVAGQFFVEVPVLNPGVGAGGAWLVRLAGRVGPSFVVVEAPDLDGAITALEASSRYGHLSAGAAVVSGEAAFTYHGRNLPTAGVRPLEAWLPESLV